MVCQLAARVDNGIAEPRDGVWTEQKPLPRKRRRGIHHLAPEEELQPISLYQDHFLVAFATTRVLVRLTLYGKSMVLLSRVACRGL
jgi:hypothetical protein